MHAKTLAVITILAVMAALLVGINIGRKLNPELQLLPSPALSPQLTQSPSASTTTGKSSDNVQGKQTTNYSHPQCGISFPLPSGFEIDQQASDGAKLVNQSTQAEINLVCGKQLPKPPLALEKIEAASVSGLPATVYHDAQAQDGTPVDVVMFVNPKNQLEVALLGFGNIFQQVWQNLILL